MNNIIQCYDAQRNYEKGKKYLLGTFCLKIKISKKKRRNDEPQFGNQKLNRYDLFCAGQ
jgi:hypothetical protein